MAPSIKSFPDQLAEKIATLPIFLRPQLSPILGDLLAWVESVEKRLTFKESATSVKAAIESMAPRCICPIEEGASSRFCPVHRQDCGECQ